MFFFRVGISLKLSFQLMETCQSWMSVSSWSHLVTRTMAPKRLEPSRMARIGMPHEDGGKESVLKTREIILTKSAVLVEQKNHFRHFYNIYIYIISISYIYMAVSQNEAAGTGSLSQGSVSRVCFVVCFGGLFRTVLLPRTVKFKGSVSGSVSKVCFGVCFGGLFRQSRTSQPYLKLHSPKKCKPIYYIHRRKFK